VGIETIELGIGEDNPVTSQMNASLLSFGEYGEHVDVPLAELMNPVRDLE